MSSMMMLNWMTWKKWRISKAAYNSQQSKVKKLSSAGTQGGTTVGPAE